MYGWEREKAKKISFVCVVKQKNECESQLKSYDYALKALWILNLVLQVPSPYT